MKSIKALFILIIVILFASTSCRSLTGQRESKQEKDIRYQQKKIDESRGMDTENEFKKK